MSRPRGKAIQRELADLATEMLRPYGCHCEIDFSRSGGHQKLKIKLPDGGPVHSMDLASTPKNKDHALTFMRQRVQRLIRDHVPH